MHNIKRTDFGDLDFKSLLKLLALLKFKGHFPEIVAKLSVTNFQQWHEVDFASFLITPTSNSSPHRLQKNLY